MPVVVTAVGTSINSTRPSSRQSFLRSLETSRGFLLEALLFVDLRSRVFRGDVNRIGRREEEEEEERGGLCFLVLENAFVSSNLHASIATFHGVVMRQNFFCFLLFFFCFFLIEVYQNKSLFIIVAAVRTSPHLFFSSSTPLAGRALPSRASQGHYDVGASAMTFLDESSTSRSYLGLQNGLFLSFSSRSTALSSTSPCI